MLDKGIGLVLITLGNRGAFYRYKGGYNLIKGFKVKPVDTTGAGDAFMGGMLYNLCSIVKNELPLINKNRMDYMVKFANAVGALTVTRYGAMPAMPVLNEVKKIRV